MRKLAVRKLEANLSELPQEARCKSQRASSGNSQKNFANFLRKILANLDWLPQEAQINLVERPREARSKSE